MIFFVSKNSQFSNFAKKSRQIEGKSTKTPSSVQNCHEVNQSWTLPILPRSGGGGGGCGTSAPAQVGIFFVFHTEISFVGWYSKFHSIGIGTASWTQCASVVGTGRGNCGWGHHDSTPLTRGRDRSDKLVMLMIHGLVIAVIGTWSHMVDGWTVFLLK